MNARDDCYKPDDEELAYELYKEREFESMRLEYGDVDRELRDYREHTDRQLRGLSKERKSLAREIWQEYQFDVARDAYEVHLNSETSITMPREGLRRDKASRLLFQTSYFLQGVFLLGDIQRITDQSDDFAVL